ncbi:G-protein coupled receptor dmsr-1-like [Littorina saxatilis]|uniref:G-protein coupled receptor dmsr-1-like n=1 Tax=Littorina saxatilis TaxID=31220 RepID=UPI0038B64A4F
MANFTDMYATAYEVHDATSSVIVDLQETDLIEVTTQGALKTSAIEQFGQSYQRIHGYFSVTVCVFGIVSNVLNIIVLTRKHMKSPTNFILTALAIADMLTMSTYPIMAIYLYIITSPDCMTPQHSRGWMYFILFHNLFIVTCHNMAMWLTVTLAVFRYIFVCQHAIAARLCSLDRAKLTVAVVVVATIVSCVPNYFVYSVQDIGPGLSRNVSCYWIVASQLAQANPTYEQFVRWLFGVVIKILPCVLMAFLSTLLIIAMQQAKKRRARLLNKVSRIVDHDHQSSEHNRTTMMLVGVVVCFIVTEIPQGILAWISAVDEDFWNDVYIHVGDLMDILVLVNSAVNFILYCIMSQQFRNTFKSLFVCNNIPFNLDRKVGKSNGTEYSMVRTETTNV